jgi:hypothetical protein
VFFINYIIVYLKKKKKICKKNISPEVGVELQSRCRHIKNSKKNSHFFNFSNLRYLYLDKISKSWKFIHTVLFYLFIKYLFLHFFCFEWKFQHIFWFYDWLIHLWFRKVKWNDGYFLFFLNLLKNLTKIQLYHIFFQKFFIFILNKIR